MERLDTVVRGGNVVSSRGIRELDIGISDGKVRTLTAPGLQFEAVKTIDARGRFVLPGCVDAHVHSREPGLTHKEDFLTLTSAAAVGGVTTVMCQPNTLPPIHDVATFAQVVEEWPKKAMVDFAVQAGADPTRLGEIAGLLDAGAISIELITPEATGHMLGEILRVIDEHGGLAGVSVPDGGYAQFAKQRLQEAGRKDVSAWVSAWPTMNEAIGVARILILTEGTPYRFQIQMITTRRAIALIREARQTGRDTFTVETSPNYLLLTEDDHQRLGPYGLIHPRFKTPDDVDAVWEGILDGTIDMIDTDHAPHGRSEKEMGREDIWKAPPGIPEIELSLRLMLNEVNRGRLTLPRVTALMAEAQARRYGLYPRKGALEIGSDADLVVVDMDHDQPVEDAALVTASKYSPFSGRSLRGAPVVTLLRGEVIARDGNVVASRPAGQFVRPPR